MSELTITMYADADGFVSFECPYCGSVFKLSANDLNDESFPVFELFCPYCGLADEPSNFLSAEVIEAAKSKAYNYLAETLNREFGKMKNSVNRNKGIIRMDFTPMKLEHEKDVIDDDTVETIFQCSVCEREVKVLYNIGVSKSFCPYCGVDI